MCRAAAVLQVRSEGKTASWECQQAFIGDDGQAQVSMRALEGATELTIPVSGYQGISTCLPPAPVEDAATRPSQRIRHDDCTPAQWAVLQRHFQKFQVAGKCHGELKHHKVGQVMPDHAPAARGQQTMHAYGEPGWAAEMPTHGVFRPTNQQSQQEWSYHYRPHNVGDITFDTTSVVPTPVCSHGTWTAMSRHGQAVIHQHPSPRHGHRVKPTKHDLTLDAAHLKGLLQDGAQLPEIAAACERQTSEGLCAKALSSGMGIANGATTWWGCTSLTWDRQFPQYVSPCAEDEQLGSSNFTKALAKIGENSIIMLDSFSEEQRKLMLYALRDTKHTQ